MEKLEIAEHKALTIIVKTSGEGGDRGLRSEARPFTVAMRWRRTECDLREA